MYRKEHPKPQFYRKNWENLNGEWEFQIDNADSGRERGLFEATALFDRVITVPFCPQSKLSGIGETDFMRAVWYRRHFTLGDEQTAGRVVLHCGAVDYEAYIYVNGTLCGTHRGGYVSFAVDITKAVHTGDNIVTVLARDDERDRRIPSGKQSMKLRSSHHRHLADGVAGVYAAYLYQRIYAVAGCGCRCADSAGNAGRLCRSVACSEL